jgi:methionine-rich copper-binding protein CopC
MSEADPVFAEPEVTASTPRDGEVLAQPPTVLNLCFSEPVKTEGDDAWTFVVRPEAGASLGLRIEFAEDATCANVYPGPSELRGIWAFDWTVHAQSDDSEGSGTILFQVGELGPGQTPLPAPETPDVEEEDESVPPALVALVAVGVLILAVGVGGFLLRRRKA